MALCMHFGSILGGHHKPFVTQSESLKHLTNNPDPPVMKKEIFLTKMEI
jgi:hypothetical protein